MWISPGLRAHEEEFRQAWVARVPGRPEDGRTSVPPKMTYKAWYKQFKRTRMPPGEWIDRLMQGPPASGPA